MSLGRALVATAEEPQAAPVHFEDKDYDEHAGKMKILASAAATCAQRATSFMAEFARAAPLQPR